MLLENVAPEGPQEFLEMQEDLDQQVSRDNEELQ